MKFPLVSIFAVCVLLCAAPVSAQQWSHAGDRRVQPSTADTVAFHHFPLPHHADVINPLILPYQRQQDMNERAIWQIADHANLSVCGTGKDRVGQIDLSCVEADGNHVGIAAKSGPQPLIEPSVDLNRKHDLGVPGQKLRQAAISSPNLYDYLASRLCELRDLLQDIRVAKKDLTKRFLRLKHRTRHNHQYNSSHTGVFVYRGG